MVILTKWFLQCKDLLTSPDPQAHSQLNDTLSKLKITRGELEATKVTPDIIQKAIKKLKRGKSDGEALTSDHLISAPTSLSKILAPIVTSLLQHGHMPSCVSDAIVHPIPKGGNKDYSLSVNYRDIALASCLSKINPALWKHPVCCLLETMVT